ncbi:MAG TPA: hypothetical protein PLO37_18075 [Candidatus Hydrogenedentes bacterium]|nr:hypothetical protein [Candidatus Hydrogenedentota bacterium]HPG68759.1 hypothetical protein [Candidatus Hydrogenedentota bacterium]
MLYTLAKLTDAQLDALRCFEKKSGLKILALSEVDVEFAPIDADMLMGLQELETDLDVCLIAVC